MTDFKGIIECLEEIRDEMCSHCDREACEFELCRKTEALNRAILLFNKQIPKKPEERYIYESFVTDWLCPTCGRFHRTDYPLEYCSNCGQKINLGGEE